MSKTYACFLAFLLAPVQSSALAASTPLIHLSADALGLGPIASWANTGPLGGSFGRDGTNPQVQDIAGRRCVTFSGSDRMKATFTAPSGITGNGDYTVAAWVYNPALAYEECYLSWAHRGGPACTCCQMNYGSSPDWGAVTHWEWPDMGFGSAGPPSTGTWHHLAVTYDGAVEKVYVDGFLANREPKTLNLYSGGPVYLGCAYANADGTGQTLYYSGSIASLRVYDTALSVGEIAALAGLQTYTMSGTVTADGSPLGNAVVAIKNSPDATITPNDTALAGADGRYSFTVTPLTWYVAAQKSGYVPRPTPDAVVTVTDSDISGVDFALTYVGMFRAQAFDVSRVRLLDGPFKDAMERDRAYLHYLDSDRLLHMFRVTAGLPSSAQPLGGVGGPKLRGARPHNGSLPLSLRSDVRRRGRHGAESQGGRHSGGACEMPGCAPIAGLQRRLPAGVPRILVRPGGQSAACLGALVYDAQDNGRPVGYVPLLRQHSGARRVEQAGFMGQVPDRPAELRPDASLAQQRVRRYGRGACQSLCRDRKPGSSYGIAAVREEMVRRSACPGDRQPEGPAFEHPCSPGHRRGPRVRVHR